MKNDRVCVPRCYPIDHIKPRRKYIIQYSNSLFIANGNIYVQVRKDNDEKCYCCAINKFKRWGGIDNLKKFVSLKDKREVKTISDLMDAVMECGYSREIDYFEYTETESDSLMNNSEYKYSFDDLVFHGCENIYEGFEKLESPRYGLQIGKFHDSEINFYLDLGIGGLRKDIPNCVLEEIANKANKLLEVNFVKPEDIKKVKFTCYTKVNLSHYYHYGNVAIKCGKLQNDNSHHVFHRNYSIHIGIDKNSDYYNGFELDDVDAKFLKHQDIYLYEMGLEDPFDEFIKDEMFR